MTTTAEPTLQSELNRANPNTIADALRAVKLGTALTLIKVTVASLTATATPDITAAATKAAATVSGITLADGENLPPIAMVRSLRVTTSGTGTVVGTYGITDSGGTAVTAGTSGVMGIAKLSDDGTTLTFTATVTGFVIEYYAMPATALSSAWSTDV